VRGKKSRGKIGESVVDRGSARLVAYEVRDILEEKGMKRRRRGEEGQV
jgi:hypothetical protein